MEKVLPSMISSLLVHGGERQVRSHWSARCCTAWETTGCLWLTPRQSMLQPARPRPPLRQRWIENLARLKKTKKTTVDGCTKTSTQSVCEERVLGRCTGTGSCSLADDVFFFSSFPLLCEFFFHPFFVTLNAAACISHPVLAAAAHTQR